VHARSGGVALGLLRRGDTSAYAGVLLDHDLDTSKVTEADSQLSATNIVPLLQQRLKKTVPILIHSHNLTRARAMEQALSASGFSVTRRRFEELHTDSSVLQGWIGECLDNWEPAWK